MKGVVKTTIISMLLALICMSTPLKGQGLLTFAAGMGSPELLHLGLRVKIANQLHLGAYIGIDDLPTIDWSAFHGTTPKDTGSSHGVAAFYHFAGNSQYTELPPWYFRAGYSHSRTNSYNYTHKTYWADIRLGRVFSLSHNVGVELDFGINILLHENAEIKPNRVVEDLSHVSANKARPGGACRIFFRF